jgi:uncharacterized membrane protein YdbT with pleckstrin-like domain
MSCRQCSAELPAGSLYCNRCGASQIDESAEGAPPFSPQGIQPPEEQLWAGRYSLRAATHLWLLSVLWMALAASAYLHFVPERTQTGDLVAAAAALVPAVMALIRTMGRRLSLRYRLTNDRLFTERGILSRQHDEIELIRVDDISMRQNLLQRLFGVGTVIVLSTDTSSPELTMEGIAHPIELKELLRSQVRARRARTTFLERL